MTMVSHIKGESDRIRMAPLRRFALTLKDQIVRDQREQEGFEHGCGVWNLGDGNLPDDDPFGGQRMNIVIEQLPPLEPKKEKIDSQKNIFGSKGELLLGIDEDLYSEVAGEPSEAKKLRRKQNLISLEEPEVEAITIDDDNEG